MNYWFLIYNKQNWTFRKKRRKFGIVGNVFLCCWCVLYYKLFFFNACIGFRVIFCIYDHILKLFHSSKLSRSVNNYRTNCFFCDLFSPPHPHPRRQSIFPSRGKHIEETQCLSDWLWFLWFFMIAYQQKMIKSSKI